VSFRTRGGVPLDGVEIGSGPNGAVLLHMVASDLCDWWPFAGALGRAGVHALLVDQRCSGRPTCPPDAKRLLVLPASAGHGTRILLDRTTRAAPPSTRSCDSSGPAASHRSCGSSGPAASHRNEDRVLCRPAQPRSPPPAPQPATSNPASGAVLGEGEPAVMRATDPSRTPLASTLAPPPHVA